MHALAVLLLLLTGVAEKPPARGAAQVWYTGTSGWAVRTEKHLLVFDYLGARELPNAKAPGAALDPAALRGVTTIVFVTHEHQDHYSEDVFAWKGPNVHYVFGWPVTGKPVTTVGPGETREVAGVTVSAVQSTDAGVAFLVTVDGLRIFHAGDHARWSDATASAYERELVSLAKHAPVDLAFLPIATGLRCEATPSLIDGALFAMKTLQPRATFPMHVRCSDKLSLYSDFQRTAQERLPDLRVFAAAKTGDTFFTAR